MDAGAEGKIACAAGRRAGGAEVESEALASDNIILLSDMTQTANVDS